MAEIARKPDRADNDVHQVRDVLERYEQRHPGSSCFVYRYNSASIRVKIVDPSFEGVSKGDRHDHAWNFLTQLPEDILSQITILLCLVPGEVDFMDIEFENPSRSLL